MLFGKPIDHIELADLRRLIDNGVLEMKGLDYKRQFTGNTDAEKKELLYDLTSFANAGGGYIIYGIREQDGIPVEIEGVDIALIDGEKLKIENMLRDGVEPRIPGFAIHARPR
jgi:predicted HTH transcriptional regulator